MKKNVTVWCILLWLSPSDNFRTQEMSMLPGKTKFGATTTHSSTDPTEIETTTDDIQFVEDVMSDKLQLLHVLFYTCACVFIN
ncbi:unnamed protein product [Arctia plantaginis]|uniref:Uncharacterized protein n=1 Tax=Arctia plantaginis TaxID=874455 RepID=A0A8S1BLT6_ARCPL|nr:unnamed protein product [Arctia plantaginis]